MTERTVASWEVGGLAVHVSERGHVIVSTQPGEIVARYTDPARLAELQQVLDAAAVEQNRVASGLNPPARPYTSRVLAELNPQQGATTRQIATQANLKFTEVYCELLSLHSEGRVRQELDGGRSIWWGKPPAGNLEWHEGTHSWDTHDGYRRHQHSLNGALTIAPGDTQVHFAHGPAFD